MRNLREEGVWGVVRGRKSICYLNEEDARQAQKQGRKEKEKKYI